MTASLFMAYNFISKNIQGNRVKNTLLSIIATIGESSIALFRNIYS
jgi:hypothetical protein